MLEKKIQKKIKDKLQSLGFKVLRPINVSISGLPDLWALKQGKLIFIEVKRPGERLTKLQERRKKELEDEGFKVYVFDNESDVSLITT